MPQGGQCDALRESSLCDENYDVHWLHRWLLNWRLGVGRSPA